MINRDLLNDLYSKIINDYEEYKNSMLEEDNETIFNNAFDIHHAQNFVFQLSYFIQEYDVNNEYTHAIDEHTIDTIINFKENIIGYWITHRYDIRHFERYNLENFDDFASVLICVIENLDLILC